jgi:hypothetical protein
MVEEKNELDELSKEIRQIITDNQKFLARIMAEDFAAEGEDEAENSDNYSWRQDVH